MVQVSRDCVLSQLNGTPSPQKATGSTREGSQPKCWQLFDRWSLESFPKFSWLSSAAMSMASLAKTWAISCGRRKGRDTVMMFPVLGCRVRTSAQYRGGHL
eukprot:2861554-Heterocapsa_arctica.AAC.1